MSVIISLERDSILVMDITLGEMSVSLPISFVILVQLKESHRDISLLDTLNEDEDLVTTRHTSGVRTDSADFQVTS